MEPQRLDSRHFRQVRMMSEEIILLIILLIMTYCHSIIAADALRFREQRVLFRSTKHLAHAMVCLQHKVKAGVMARRRGLAVSTCTDTRTLKSTYEFSRCQGKKQKVSIVQASWLTCPCLLQSLKLLQAQ